MKHKIILRVALILAISVCITCFGASYFTLGPGTTSRKLLDDKQISGEFLIYKREPQSREEIENWFASYQTTSEVSRETTVTIFSIEQANEFELNREQRIRRPLTQDEVFYLIENSIKLYHKYDWVQVRNEMFAPTEALGSSKSVASIAMFLDKQIAVMDCGYLHALEYHLGDEKAVAIQGSEKSTEYSTGGWFSSNHWFVTILDSMESVDEDYETLLTSRLLQFTEIYENKEIPYVSDCENVYYRYPALMYDKRNRTFIMWDLLTLDAMVVYSERTVSEYIANNNAKEHTYENTIPD